MQNTLDICKVTRKIAADSLYIVLQKVLSTNDSISESDFCNAWFKELRKNKSLLKKGWYEPPPYGIGVLFANEENIKRANFPTLRDEKYWPKDTIFLNKNSDLITVYCSPVNKTSGIIGDFGLTLYLGKNKQIQKHLATILNINKEIFNSIKLNMSFRNLYTKAEEIIKEKHYTNSGWISINDPAKINMGHTIPELPKRWKREDIAKKRIFFNAKEETQIKKGMAFTIEPRLKSTLNASLPTAYYHTMVLIKENGKKELLTNFDKIFKLAGMTYML